MKSLKDQFFGKTTIGTNMEVSYVTVPISSLVHPLCVFPDFGAHRRSYIIVLPSATGVDFW